MPKTNIIGKRKETLTAFFQSASTLTHEDRFRRLLDLEQAGRADVVEHEESVSRLVADIANELGLPEFQVLEISIAARLHDVGKIAVDGSILYKRGRLDEGEREVMKNHTLFGKDLLHMAGVPREIWEGALYHHERYDGHGYYGLSGDDIPLAARIIAVADIYDALVSERSYKKALPEEKALDLITRDVGPPHLGKHAFDPRILEAFLDIKAERSIHPGMTA